MASAWLAEAGDALVSVLFPAECRLCERLLTRASRVPICQECLLSFKPLPPPLCRLCGQPWGMFQIEQTQGHPESSDAGAMCRACSLGTYAFDLARSFALYEGASVRAIILLKFERIEPLAGWFAKRLAELARAEGLEADVVVPVPLHRERMRERGYNQADLVARPLAKLLKLRYQGPLLVRTRPRPDKHVLTLGERWESVRGAFATRPRAQVDKLRVLLVDDVMTTGATLDACARALREAGAKSVIGLTVARAARHPTVGSGESEPRDAR
jgi:ComF family protein